MKNAIRTCLLLLAASLGGCQVFTLETPRDFVALEEPSWSDYALRTTNADGVVLAVRQIENDRHGTLGFWRKAIENRVHAVHGYALLAEEEVTASTGEPGRRLTFGRDEENQSFAYELTVFVTPERLLSDGHVLIVETGGKKVDFDASATKVRAAVAGIAID